MMSFRERVNNIIRSYLQCRQKCISVTRYTKWRAEVFWLEVGVPQVSVHHVTDYLLGMFADHTFVVVNLKAKCMYKTLQKRGDWFNDNNVQLT